MTSCIADELEILEQSNGGCLGDESWTEDGLSWNGSDNDVEKASDLDREWQSRRDRFCTIGYRDGLIAGKEASAQDGFNTGFSESVLVGYKWGLVRGVTSALASLPDAVREMLVESEEKRNKFHHLHMSVDSISTYDALKLFLDDMFNNVEKQRECTMAASHKDEEHIPGSSDNLLETYIQVTQALILGSPSLEVNLKAFK